MKIILEKILIVPVFIFAISLAMANGQKVHIAISSSPSALSPFLSTDSNSQNINRLVHISLTDFDETMNFACHLCQSYKEGVTDGKYYIRFKLRRDVTFWDGTGVTASDVEKSVKYFTETQKIKSIFRFAFKKIKNVVVYNDYDVEFRYDKYELEHLSNLALLKIIKLKNLDSAGNILSKPKMTDIVGAGPYRPGEHSELSLQLIPREKHLVPMHFKVVRDETTLALKLINKEVDLSLANISPRKYKWLKKKEKSNLKFWERASTNYQYIGINHKKKALKDYRVRKALSLLIPREKILKHKLKGTAVLATGMFSSAFTDMYENLKHDAYDPDQAQRLLKEAGYKKNIQGILEKDGKPFIIDWKSPSNKAAVEMVNTLKSFFEKVGIKVIVTVQEWGTFMQSFKTGQYDVVLGRWVGFTGPDMLNWVFHSKSVPPKGANRGFYQNDMVDKYLDMALDESNRKKRIELYRNVQRIAMNDYAYINLWHPNVIWIGRSCISGIILRPNGSYFPLMNLQSNCERE